MIHWIKDKIRRFWRWLVVGSVVVAATGAAILPPEIPKFMIDGQEVVMAYTDDNTGEDLIIRTNGQEYFNHFGVISVIYSITNNSGKNQNVKMAFSFDDYSGQKQYVEEIKEYLGEETVVKTISVASGTEQVVNVSKTKWGNAVLKSASRDLSAKRKKPIADNYTYRENNFLLLANETKFFQAIIKYLPTQNNEFFIEAFGDQNGYGHLDPYDFEDKFNSDTKTTGALNGQDGWTEATANLTVTAGTAPTVPVYDGNQGVQTTINGTANNPTGVTDYNAGTAYVALANSDATNGTTRIDFGNTNGCTQIPGAVRITGGQVQYLVQTTGWVNLLAASNDTWYVMKLEFDDVAQPDQFKYSVYSGGNYNTTSGWITAYDAWTNVVDICMNRSGGTAYFDTITPTDPVVAAAAVIPTSPLIIFE